MSARWRSDLVFALSGAAALVYQLVWARLLGRVVGSDAVGVALVLGVFMGGLGLGSFAGARWVARLESARLAYVALELLLAAWAVGTAFAFGLLDPLESFGLRAALAVAVLLPPTALMGATFPLMGRLVIADRTAGGAETSGFYGANTLGAVGGVLLAAFLLLPTLGLSWTLVAGAGLEVLAGLGALALREPAASSGPTPRPTLRPAPSPDEPPPAPRPLLRLALLAGAFGFAGLGLELLFTRLLTSVTGASVFAFALVLAVFLAGIGLGSRQARSWLATPGSGERLLGRTAGALPLLVFGGLLLFGLQLGERDLFTSLHNRMPTAASPWRLWASHALFAGLALFPCALALGVALPATIAAGLEACDAGDSRVLGSLYAANSAGAMLGSLVVAFVAAPALGPRWSLALLAFLPGLAWLGGGRPGPRGWGLAGAGLLLGLAALWPAERPASLLAFRFGRSSSVAVEESTPSGGVPVRALRVNGKVVATSAPVDLRLQRLLGYVPGLLHAEVRDALVIGLGTGMTAGAVADLEGLERLEIFEIAPAVVELAPAFAAWNGALLEDPRVQLTVADGRHALATSERRFDLVTSDPIHPWTRGSSDLYALEHFAAMRAHLAPGGIASQWLPLYQLSEEDVRTVVATWCAAFEACSAWLSAYDLVLVGWSASEGARLFPPQGAGASAWNERVRRGLAQAGVHSQPELEALCVADDARLRAFAAGASPMGEDRPVLEFRAPLSFLTGYSTEALAWSADEAFLDVLPPRARERGRAVRDALRTFLEELPAGQSEAARRYGERLLALEPLVERP